MLALVRAHEIVQVLQPDGAVAGRSRQLGIRLRFYALQRDFLEIRAVVAGRLGARQCELGGEEFGGELPAAGAHPAALQQVAREKLHAGPDALAGNVRHLAGAGGRQGQD